MFVFNRELLFVFLIIRKMCSTWFLLFLHCLFIDIGTYGIMMSMLLKKLTK